LGAIVWAFNERWTQVTDLLGYVEEIMTWQVWYDPEKNEIVLSRLSGLFYDYRFSDSQQYSYWSPHVNDFEYIGEFE
jgi:hypothetical protein